jgi:hypothetical protein
MLIPIVICVIDARIYDIKYIARLYGWEMHSSFDLEENQMLNRVMWIRDSVSYKRLAYEYDVKVYVIYVN